MKSNSLLLYKAQIYSQFHINSYKKNVGAAPKSKSRLIVLGFAYLLVGLMIVGYSAGLSFGLCSIQMGKAVPSLALAVCSLITLIFTIFKVNGILFAFKDYELLTALPIKTGDIIASRFLMLYVMSTATSALVMVPMGLVYGIYMHCGFLFYAAWLVVMLIAPLVPITIACVIGALITWGSTKFKHTNAALIVLSIIAFVAIMVFSFSLSFVGDNVKFSIEQLSDLSNSVSASINKIYPLSALFTNAVIDGSIVSFLLLIGISVAWYALFVFLLSKKYKAINSVLMEKRAYSNYKFVEQKAKSQLIALYKKELKRLFSSAVYLMNSSSGAIMIVIAGIMLLFVDPKMITGLTGDPVIMEMIKKAMPFAIGGILGISCTSSVSLSMEGKQLWILQSSPIKSITIFHSKILVNLTVLLPAALLTSMFASISFSTSIATTAAFFVVPIIYSFFISVWGMFVNIKMPNFDWLSETVLVKQSAASMIGMLGGAMLGVIPAIMAIALKAVPAYIFTPLFCVAILILMALFYRTIKKATI